MPKPRLVKPVSLATALSRLKKAHAAATPEVRARVAAQVGYTIPDIIRIVSRGAK